MRDLFSDLNYTLRQLRRSPGFALTTILTLTMAITANVVVFGIVNALLLHPLPLPKPRQLVMIESAGMAVSYPNYRDLRDRNRTFSGVAIERIARIGVGVNGVAQPVRATRPAETSSRRSASSPTWGGSSGQPMTSRGTAARWPC
jgi:hypothetical protein